MRPTRSRKYCHDCGFRKIRFSSEEKALNFIRFNAEEIQGQKGYAPIRAYYCDTCGCWHLTSKPDFPFKSRTQRVLEAYHATHPEGQMPEWCKRAPCLITVKDEALNQIVADNFKLMAEKKAAEERKKKVRKILHMLTELKAEKERPAKEEKWLEDREQELCLLEERLNRWVHIAKLPKLCLQFRNQVNSKLLTHANALRAYEFLVRVDEILERRNEILALVDAVTLHLLDAYSYKQSDMYASVKAKVREAESALKRLEQLHHEGFAEAMEVWRSVIDDYNLHLRDRDVLG